MKQKAMLIGFVFFVMLFVMLFSRDFFQQNDSLVLQGPYLGQKPPGMTPEFFAPGIVSTENNTEVLDINATKKGRIVFYRDLFGIPPKKQPLYGGGITFELKNGKWRKSTNKFYFHGPNNPTLSLIPDENILSFAHNRTVDGLKVSSHGHDIWIARETKDGKYQVRWLGPKINSKGHDSWASMTKTGTIYFYSDREGGFGGTDIYRVKLFRGKYLKAENLGPPVNTKFAESDPYVSRDGSYIVFCSGSQRKGFGKADLYVTFKLKDDSWTKPINLGNKINTAASETRPMLTRDGKYMFFSRENHKNNLDIYWVSTKIIAELKLKISNK